jgi:hypothetical protein
MNVPCILIALFGLAGLNSSLAQACCGGGATSTSSGCNRNATATAACTHEAHGNQQAAHTTPAAATKASLPKPVQAVFDEYVKVQTALAEDSSEKAKAAALALVKAIQSDSDDLLPADVSQHAHALAEARDRCGSHGL